MSTRYVWEKYSTETEIYKVDNALYKSTFSMNDTAKYGFCGFNSYTIDGNRLYFDEPITRYYVTLENTEDNPVYVNEQFFHIEGYTLDTDTYIFLSQVQSGGLCERKSTSQKPYIYIKQFPSITTPYTLAINNAYGYKDRDIKGKYRGLSSGASQSSYPTDGVSGSYWYTYKGSDNIDPIAVNYSTTSPKGGSAITIKVTARSNTYGGTIKYQYQVQLDSGSWTTLTTTTSTSYSYTIPKGTNTFRARVRASDNYGFTSSTYVTGSTLNVINNTAPTISGSNSNLGSFAYIPPYIEYVINDVDGNTVSVSIQLDSQSIYRGTAVLGKTKFIIFPDWDSLLNGSHTVTITANDGQGGITTRTYTFSKSVNANLISRERWRRLNEGNVYDVIYFETAADVVTTNNGKYLRDRINAILSRIAALKGTSAAALAAMDSSIITERLHMKIDSGYNVKYLDTKSQYVKIGSQTVEEVLTQIESDIAALKG